jgi:hypothetical protein
MTSGNFCANCGQKTDIHPITLGHVAHDFIHAFTHADKGFLMTLKQMVLKPGIVAKEYIEGKRKKYFNPLSFLVITMAVSAYLSYETGYFEAFGRPKVTTTQSQSVQGEKVEQKKPVVYSEFSKVMWQARKIIVNHGKILGLVLIVPLITLMSWMFFRKPKHGYAEHFVLQSYLFGYMNVARGLIFIPLHVLLPGNIEKIDAGFQIFYLFYLILAAGQLFKQNIIVTILKCILMLALFIVLFWLCILGYAYVKYLLFQGS